MKGVSNEGEPMSEHREPREEKADTDADDVRAKQEEAVEDLDVAEGDAENVKGGISLNYSKIHFE
jgi:hypothetical protein